MKKIFLIILIFISVNCFSQLNDTLAFPIITKIVGIDTVLGGIANRLHSSMADDSIYFCFKLKSSDVCDTIHGCCAIAYSSIGNDSLVFKKTYVITTRNHRKNVSKNILDAIDSKLDWNAILIRLKDL